MPGYQGSTFYLICNRLRNSLNHRTDTWEINRERGERKTIGKLNELFNQTLLESYLLVFCTIVAIPQFYQLSLSQSLSLCFRQLCAETSQVKKCLHFDPQMYSVAAISPLNPEALVSNDAQICHIKLLNIIISELYATNLIVFLNKENTKMDLRDLYALNK